MNWNITIKVIVAISLLVIILSYIENIISSNSFNCAYELDKDIMKIAPPCLNLSDYIYVINTETINQDRLKLNNMSNYAKKYIYKNISESVLQPLSDVKNSIGEMFKSPMIISSMQHTLAKICNTKDSFTNTVTGYGSEYLLYYPKKNVVNCFIHNNILYFTK